MLKENVMLKMLKEKCLFLDFKHLEVMIEFNRNNQDKLRLVSHDVSDTSYLNIFLFQIPEEVEEEDGEWIRFLGGNSSSGTKKYQGSNSSDGGNTGYGVKIAGGVIASGDEIGMKTMEPGFELQEAKMMEMGRFGQYFHSYALYLVPGASNL
ncbi:hypothetical protein Tco_0631534 [Tanacetum coccineum]